MVESLMLPPANINAQSRLFSHAGGPNYCKKKKKKKGKKKKREKRRGRKEEEEEEKEMKTLLLSRVIFLFVLCNN